MAINYFEKELNKIQKHFNQTFGQLIVCDLKLRQQVILAIIAMERLNRKIRSARNKDQVRYEIQRFMKTKMILQTIFHQIEREENKRRSNEHYNVRKKKMQYAGGQAGT